MNASLQLLLVFILYHEKYCVFTFSPHFNSININKKVKLLLEIIVSYFIQPNLHVKCDHIL